MAAKVGQASGLPMATGTVAPQTVARQAKHVRLREAHAGKMPVPRLKPPPPATAFLNSELSISSAIAFQLPGSSILSALNSAGKACIMANVGIEERIKQKALELGFDAAGITDASPVSQAHADRFSRWLGRGFAAEMSYMRRSVDKRLDPGALLEGAESVLCVAMSYKRPDPAPFCKAGFGRVAVYACYQDYHAFIRDLLRKLADFIRLACGGGRFKLCVDSVPIAERALAERAGMGFIGTNHMLINPDLGPEVLLAEIVTDVKLRPDPPAAGGCGGCRKCVEACPTGALRADGLFDAGKCISYLTIEYGGEIPAALAAGIGSRLFGCEECVRVCPLAEKKPACSNERFGYWAGRAVIDLRRVLLMDRKDFKSLFGGSPVERSGLSRMKRNARVCLANLKYA